MPKHNRPLYERFWDSVDRSEGASACWPWTRAVDPDGYGRITAFYTYTGAHRVSFMLCVGPIPRGFQIDHLCGNTVCVNPAHLEAVTQQENNRRSNSPTAKNIRKTRCNRGHELSGDNLIQTPGRRRCRTCHHANQRASHLKREGRAHEIVGDQTIVDLVGALAAQEIAARHHHQEEAP